MESTHIHASFHDGFTREEAEGKNRAARKVYCSSDNDRYHNRQPDHEEKKTWVFNARRQSYDAPIEHEIHVHHSSHRGDLTYRAAKAHAKIAAHKLGYSHIDVK